MTTPALPLLRRSHAWFSRHVLLLAVVFLLPAFLLTGWLVGTYHALEHRLATSWYRQGEADVAAGRLDAAIDDYRAALAYARDNAAYRLRLAQALQRAGRLEPASADLHRLWEDQPANSIVNLELARLSVRRHDTADAVRYYNNAIYGVWPSDAAVRRRDTQMELIDYLLANHRNGDALAGLMALAADAPPDAALRLAIGRRMLEAGGEQQALREFREAVALAPRSPGALSAAGGTALKLGQFADAERYLRQAVRAGDDTAATSQQLATARTVLRLDPFARGLSSGERVERIRRAFDLAMAGFGACVPRLDAGDQAARQAAALHVRFLDMAASLRTRDARDAQVQQDTMDLVLEIEEFVASHCGPLTGEDNGLLVLARWRGGQP